MEANLASVRPEPLRRIYLFLTSKWFYSGLHVVPVPIVLEGAGRGNLAEIPALKWKNCHQDLGSGKLTPR